MIGSEGIRTNGAAQLVDSFPIAAPLLVGIDMRCVYTFMSDTENGAYFCSLSSERDQQYIYYIPQLYQIKVELTSH